VLVVGIAQQVAENKTTIAEVTALIDEGCTVIGDAAAQAICDSLLTALLQGLPFLDEQLRTLAWDIPLGFCSTFFPVCTIDCCETDSAPEQLHLAFTSSDYSEMAVSWTTLNATASSTVQWGPSPDGVPPFPSSDVGDVHTYTNGGWRGQLHRAVMTGLAPGQAYSYRVGDEVGGWSDVFSYSTLPTAAGSAGRPLRILQVGDMAYDNNSDVTVATMTRLVQEGTVDFVLHIGDISYADGFESHWDLFMRKIQPVAARVAYMVCRGNHELWWNFTAYQSRWVMPPARDLPAGEVGRVGGPNNSTYYSLDLPSGVHLVVFNSETPDDTGSVDSAQVTWLAADLAAARASNASWLVAGAHRPLYCTNDGYASKNKDCTVFAPIMRSQAEATFAGAHTDLILAAHMHGYERTEAVSNSVVVTASGPNGTYVSPGAPVYVVNGAAGNREGNDDPRGDAPWSAPGAHVGTIGYGLLTVAGPHSLSYTFFAANGTALDTMRITK
jgi:hypothetical protein